MHGCFFSDKPPKLETNMYIEPQFFFYKNILHGRKAILHEKWFEKCFH